MSISVRVAMVPDNWVEVRRALAQWLVILVMVLITMAFNPRQGVAQSDPRSPTDPSDPIKLLVNKLNDRQVGAALRAQWNIDRAVWNEPVTAIRNGVTVLVTPAHADIHTSIDSAGAVWSPDGPLVSAPHNPTAARVLIPRGYQKQLAPRRMVSFAPGGGSTEYTLEPRYMVRSPVLRRGYVLCVINAWSTVATPIPLAEWPSRLNEVVVFVQKMLSTGLGLPAPNYIYAWGESRGARMLAYSSEISGTPFSGVIQERGGGDLVESALEQIQMLRELRAVTPADDFVSADYINKIGRRMKITSRDGVSRDEFIPVALTDDERSFFRLPASAKILMPIIPPYTENPATARDERFRIPTSSAAVDNGSELLKNWDPAKRPPDVRAAVSRLTPTGKIKTKILKVHGTLDPNIYPLTAIKYVQKIVDQSLTNQIRWYLVPGMGHVPATLEETFVDVNGKTISLGVELTHLDLLINWVEKGTDPGDFIAVDPSDPTKTLLVKGAHQIGLQSLPLKYFWTVSLAAAPHN